MKEETCEMPQYETKNLRIGAVPFFNAKPLSEYIHKIIPGAQIISEVPSLLEKKLLNKEIDIALLSSFTYAAHYPAFDFIPDLGIISRGAVKSVNLFLNPHLVSKYGLNKTKGNTSFFKELPLENLSIPLEKIALDLASRSSNALLKILINSSHKKNLPEFIFSPPGTRFEEQIKSNDAVLVIGDRALILAKKYHYFDLGRWWYLNFKLPFVFALWITQKDVNTSKLQPLLIQSKCQGMQNIESLVSNALNEKFKPHLNKEELFSYITENILFDLDNKSLEGLKLYFEKLKEVHLIEKIPAI